MEQQLGRLTVFHGISRHATGGILADEPRVPHSTSLDFAIARLFALRRSPPAILHGEYADAGRIIEYLVVGKQWEHHVAPGLLQDEQEIRILHAGSVHPVAVWALDGDDYKRIPL